MTYVQLAWFFYIIYIHNYYILYSSIPRCLSSPVYKLQYFICDTRGPGQYSLVKNVRGDTYTVICMGFWAGVLFYFTSQPSCTTGKIYWRVFSSHGLKAADIHYTCRCLTLFSMAEQYHPRCIHLVVGWPVREWELAALQKLRKAAESNDYIIIAHDRAQRRDRLAS